MYSLFEWSFAGQGHYLPIEVSNGGNELAVFLIAHYARKLLTQHVTHLAWSDSHRRAALGIAVVSYPEPTSDRTAPQIAQIAVSIWRRQDLNLESSLCVCQVASDPTLDLGCRPPELRESDPRVGG